jgi:methionine-rich copper-binding protein CopC
MLRPSLIAAIAFLAASPAFGHARLERASPPGGGTVSSSPPELALTFSERVEPLFSTIELRDAHNARLDIGKPQAAPGNARQLIVRLPRLAPGTYTVVWRVTSVDTHKTEGRFTFTLVP